LKPVAWIVAEKVAPAENGAAEFSPAVTAYVVYAHDATSGGPGRRVGRERTRDAAFQAARRRYA